MCARWKLGTAQREWEVRGQLQELTFPPTMGALKGSILGLVASAFVYWAIFPAQTDKSYVCYFLHNVGQII